MPSEPPTILVVEDDLASARTLQACLEAAGYRVEHASDSARGLALAEAGGVDLVLLDQHLPGVDSRAVCRRLRECMVDGYLPIILMTAAPKPAGRQASRADDADDYLGKPFDGEELRERVDGWVRLRQRVRVAREQSHRAEAVETRRELAERTERLEALQAVTLEITREHDLGVLLGLILRRAIELIGATGGIISLWEAASQTLTPCASHGVRGTVSPRIRVGDGLTGRVAARREGMIVNDYRAWPGAARPAADRAQLVMAEPILYQDELVGVVTVGHRGGRAPFTHRDQVILHSFAAQAAVAIDNARLYERLQQRLARSQTLAELNQLISATLDRDTVLQAIARAAAALLDASSVAFWEVDAPRGILCRRAGILPEEVLPFRWEEQTVGEGLVGWVAASNQVLNVPDTLADPRCIRRDWVEATGLRSFLGVPIERDGQVVAVLALARATPFVLGSDDEALLSSLCTQASTAIRNAAVYATEVEARTHFARLFHGLPTPVVISVAADGRVVDVNEAFCATLGYRREELIGRTAPEVEYWVDPADRARLLTILTDRGAYHGQELALRTRQGEVRTVLATAEYINIGDVSHVLSVFQDITEHKRTLAEQARLQATIDRLEERERIAMDLHDGVIQSLYATALVLGAQEATLPAEATMTRRVLSQTEAQIDTTIEALRRYIATLRAPATPPTDLRVELKQLVSELCAPAQVAPALALEAKATRAVPAQAAYHLLQLTHEAVSNAIRHGAASQVRVSLRRVAKGLALAIADNGRGFDPTAVATGQGLPNMAARAAQLDARLSIASTPGQGTEVRLIMPVPTRTTR